MTRTRGLVWLLALSLVFAGLRIPVSAQYASSTSGSVTFNTDDSEGDDSDKILIGAAITVVVVLLLVGWRMDRKRARYSDLQHSIDSALASSHTLDNHDLDDLRL